jgi:hypothetical protein
MSNLPRLPVPIIVAFGFGAFIAMGLLVAYLVSLGPSLEDSCRKECTAKSKAWRIVEKYPKTMVSDAKNPKVCECY